MLKLEDEVYKRSLMGEKGCFLMKGEICILYFVEIEIGYL